MTISKTIVAPVAALALAFFLVACGGNTQSASTEPEQETQTTAADESAEAQKIGEYLIVINTEGYGQVSFTHKDENFGYGDQGITHADAGDTIAMSAKPSDDSWKFVKWTKDDEDFLTTADIIVTVDGDATYAAIFEAVE